jgi:N-formylglutamate deformylase
MSIPCVLHVPHSTALIPEEDRPGIVLSDDELRRELLVMTDWFTDELFNGVPDAPEMICFPVSRLVLDPERFEDDAKEPMAARGMGVIYTTTSHGGRLRMPPSSTERERLIDTYYRPHHARLTGAVAELLARHGKALIIDCHSFPSAPLPYEPDQDPARPGICIGTDPYHTPRRLADYVMDAFETAGFTVQFDRPFAGALVPTSYWRQNADVSSFMIEVRRDLYMDETTGKRRPEIKQIAGRLSEIIGKVIENFM